MNVKQHRLQTLLTQKVNYLTTKSIYFRIYLRLDRHRLRKATLQLQPKKNIQKYYIV